MNCESSGYCIDENRMPRDVALIGVAYHRRAYQIMMWNTFFFRKYLISYLARLQVTLLLLRFKDHNACLCLRKFWYTEAVVVRCSVLPKELEYTMLVYSSFFGSSKYMLLKISQYSTKSPNCPSVPKKSMKIVIVCHCTDKMIPNEM